MLNQKKYSSKDLRERYPSLYSYGDYPKFLSREESDVASFDERIASIWPFLARKVISFANRLKSRESSNFDCEDICQSLWITLKEKDGDWNREVGPYLPFAGKLIDRALLAIREKSHTVESPRNSSCRIRKFTEQEKAGPLSEKKAKTFKDTKRSECEIGNIGAIYHRIGGGERPDGIAERNEGARDAIDAAKHGIMSLTSVEARVIGQTFGLWGQPMLSTSEVSEGMGCRRETLKRTKAKAIDKIRERLLAMGHPAVASDN